MPELVAGLVSVVVPIYDVVPFLGDCLDSLRSQTHRELQVICVDDGSTDGSADIAEQFVADDDRFQLVRQANAGLSAARNTGVGYATGEYLAFVDSDDVLAAHAYEMLLRALSGGADFASGGVHRLSSRGHYLGYPHDGAIRATDLATHVRDHHRLLRDRTIWNKLFRRTFWDAHGFTFPVGRLYEDAPVTVPAHACATKVAVVAETIYYWRVREGSVRSITQSDHDVRNLVDRFHSVDLTRRALIDAGHGDLCRVYEEQAIWDKLNSATQYLPDAPQVFRTTFLDLANAYLDEVGDAVIERLPARLRPQWRLIRQRRIDALVELVDRGYRAPRAEAAGPATRRLESGVRGLAWRDGKLRISGYAYVPGTAGRRWPTLRMLWLSADGSRRKLPLWPRSYRGPAVPAGGFTVALDPAVLRHGGRWRTGNWTVAVAATRGLRLRRDGLRVPADWAEPMPRHRVAPGVWVRPLAVGGRLRLRVTRALGWLTASRREGDDLVLDGRLRTWPAGPVRVELRAHGLAVHRAEAVVRTGADGATFTARLPIGGVALDDHTDNHAAGLYARRLGVHLVLGDKAARLVADVGYEQIRTVWGTDEVYTAVAVGGQVSLCTRPAGPVLTEARWRPDGALLLRGDSPRPAAGELLVRLRAWRRDIALPLRVADGRWEVVVDPAAAPSLAGPLPLPAGTWDLAFRSPGHRHPTVVPLGCTDAVRAALPTAAPAVTGIRCVLRRAAADRAALKVVAPRGDPAERERWRAAYFPDPGGPDHDPPAVVPTPAPQPRAGHSPRLRDVVLFDGAPGRRFPDDPAALLAELVGRPDAPPVAWTYEPGQPLPPGADPVPLGGAAWYEALATSRWLVCNDTLPHWFRARDGQVVLRLGGGWPVARFGALATAHPLGPDLVTQLSSDARHWTALASPGPSATPVLRSELRFGGPVLEYGRPANDALSTMDPEAARTEVLRRLDRPPGTRLVLYAPTRRPLDLRRPGWSDPGRLLDLPRVAAALPPGHELLVRRHPGLIDDVLGLAPGVLDVSAYPRTDRLLLAADVLITDYSALLADYAATGRPVLLYVPDLAEFEASPGLNVDLRTSSPGPLLHTSAEVAEAVRDVAAIADEYAAAAKKFAAAHQADGGGRAAARLVDWLLSAAPGRAG
ncbi:CDP-glycerol glycerophosphotransferase [Krasilnikovia cinnamomea]|uniref:CDP-glycerol glycerophosphotransferase n=1 Tax=Krasilnikovia cinnamomea TaxID=349313 RepID=A0A4Q7ZJF5_9ACTN|nr:CDP-glycerol glycerophosphotransferase family protein [Krasilnikovia cinnamomea]RZU50269.1 CDP-glycerol glycerophosphotransferase [Krasilnikovia cinnamomea]